MIGGCSDNIFPYLNFVEVASKPLLLKNYVVGGGVVGAGVTTTSGNIEPL